MLKVKGAWRFHSPGVLPDGARWPFNELVGKIAAQGENRQSILETLCVREQPDRKSVQECLSRVDGMP
jgi:hypothetical protein